MFKKKKSFEHKLIESLGFKLTLREIDDFQEILGIATKRGRLNFYMHILTDTETPNQQQIDRYKASLEQFTKRYQIDKHFLIGHIYGPKESNTILENASVIQALVQVTDPQNEYDYLGPIALYLHENQLHQTSISAIRSIVSIEQLFLKQSFIQCPFLDFRVLSNEFKFIYTSFEYYYIGYEFSKFYKTLYRRKLQQSFHDQIKEHIDYSTAPDKVMEVNKLLQKVEMRKKELVKQSSYETAASLRDAESRIFDKWIVAHWCDYSNLDMEQVEKEVNRLLNRR